MNVSLLTWSNKAVLRNLHEIKSWPEKLTLTKTTCDLFSAFHPAIHKHIPGQIYIQFISTDPVTKLSALCSQPTGSTIFQKHSCLLQLTAASFIHFWKTTSGNIQHLYLINELGISSAILAGTKIPYLFKLNSVTASIAIKYSYKLVCL